MLKGKKILLGVTGSIAAYKATFLVRLLVKEEATVRVIMTPSAKDFITPLTLATLSKNEVHSDFTEDHEAGTWVNHVEMGLWADLMIVAPISANTLSKLATGQSDNFLVAVYLSARCPVMVAPAMDLALQLRFVDAKLAESVAGPALGRQHLDRNLAELIARSGEPARALRQREPAFKTQEYYFAHYDRLREEALQPAFGGDGLVGWPVFGRLFRLTALALAASALCLLLEVGFVFCWTAKARRLNVSLG